MGNQTLSQDIADNITALKKLKERNPSRKLSYRLQNMYDALHQAQGKAWSEQVEQYKAAKKALDEARQAAQDAIDDLARTADAIEKAAKAFKAVLAALAVV